VGWLGLHTAVHRLVKAHRLNQPSPHTLRERLHASIVVLPVALDWRSPGKPLNVACSNNKIEYLAAQSLFYAGAVVFVASQVWQADIQTQSGKKDALFTRLIFLL